MGDFSNRPSICFQGVSNSLVFYFRGPPSPSQLAPPRPFLDLPRPTRSFCEVAQKWKMFREIMRRIIIHLSISPRVPEGLEVLRGSESQTEKHLTSNQGISIVDMYFPRANLWGTDRSIYDLRDRHMEEKTQIPCVLWGQCWMVAQVFHGQQFPLFH